MQDWYALFGCKAMANIAMRTSAFVSWLVNWLLQRLAPVTPRSQRAFQLLARSLAASTHEPVVQVRMALAVAGFFIDDHGI